jgi:homoserine O-succinyltransferase/O-acetyltransferase
MSSHADRTIQAPLAPTAPLRIGFVNLMPNPVDPIRDFSSLFAEYAGQNIEIVDLTPTPDSITTDVDRLAYRRENMTPLSTIATQNLDGLILTGFGKEDVAFENLKFWDEVTDALDHAQQQGIPVYASCWGSHAALYHHHGVTKTCDMTDKISGVFAQTVIAPKHPLMMGVPETINMPVSRYGRSNDGAMANNESLIVLAKSDETGISIATDGRVTYVTGHPEYPSTALAGEYHRDAVANTPHLRVPEGVFVNDDPARGYLAASWKKASGTFIKNWIQQVADAKATRAPTIFSQASALNHGG